MDMDVSLFQMLYKVASICDLSKDRLTFNQFKPAIQEL